MVKYNMAIDIFGPTTNEHLISTNPSALDIGIQAVAIMATCYWPSYDKGLNFPTDAHHIFEVYDLSFNRIIDDRLKMAALTLVKKRIFESGFLLWGPFAANRFGDRFRLLDPNMEAQYLALLKQGDFRFFTAIN